MDDRIIELLYRNLQEVFGEGDAPRRRAAIEDFYTSRPVSLLDTTLWKSSPETSAQHIHTSSIRLMERHKPCTTEGFWHGAQARKARPQITPDWMSSLFAMARSLRFTSFSIPNLNSGRGTVAANPRVHTEFRTSGGERFSPAVQAGRAAWRIDNDNQAARIIVFKPRGIKVG